MSFDELLLCHEKYFDGTIYTRSCSGQIYVQDKTVYLFQNITDGALPGGAPSKNGYKYSYGVFDQKHMNDHITITRIWEGQATSTASTSTSTITKVTFNDCLLRDGSKFRCEIDGVSCEGEIRVVGSCLYFLQNMRDGSKPSDRELRGYRYSFQCNCSSYFDDHIRDLVLSYKLEEEEVVEEKMPKKKMAEPEFSVNDIIRGGSGKLYLVYKIIDGTIYLIDQDCHRSNYRPQDYHLFTYVRKCSFNYLDIKVGDYLEAGRVGSAHENGVPNAAGNVPNGSIITVTKVIRLDLIGGYHFQLFNAEYHGREYGFAQSTENVYKPHALSFTETPGKIGIPIPSALLVGTWDLDELLSPSGNSIHWKAVVDPIDPKESLTFKYVKKYNL